MRAASVVVVLLLAGLLARCVIFTGGTDGYQLEDSGAGPLLGPDGGGACRKAAECGDAGLICCVVLSGTNLAAATSICQSGPCTGQPPIQLCGKNAECAGGSCVLQQCSGGGATVSIKACGVIPTCEAD
jgi:hypothetical protein